MDISTYLIYAPINAKVQHNDIYPETDKNSSSFPGKQLPPHVVLKAKARRSFISEQEREIGFSPAVESMSFFAPALHGNFRNLRLGQTFNVQTFEKGIHPFDEISKVEDNNKQFDCQCKVLHTSDNFEEINDSFVGAEMSLKLIATRLSGGVGSSKKKTEQVGVTEVFVNIKCTTVTEIVDGDKIKIKANIGSFDRDLIGTHYVSAVKYGAQLSASLKLKTSSVVDSYEKKGGIGGGLDELTTASGGLQAYLKQLFGGCKDKSTIDIKYRATEQPDMIPTSPENFMKLVNTFPDRLSQTNGGRGNPLEFELQTLGTVGITQGIKYRKNRTFAHLMGEFREQFHDLCSCSAHLKTYLKEAGSSRHPDLVALRNCTDEMLQKFHVAINNLGFDGDEVQFHESREAYKAAINGEPAPGKFMVERERLLQQLGIVSKIKLRRGKPFKAILLGKTGNGKSSTGNQIIGKNMFTVSNNATSCTRRYQAEGRNADRDICVFDTPGFMGMPVQTIKAIQKELDEHIAELKEVHVKLAGGIDAFLLVARYGSRITDEEFNSMTMPVKLFGEKAKQHMILILTHGDEAIQMAQADGVSVNEEVTRWLQGLPDEMKEFVFQELDGRVVLFDNSSPVGAASDVQVKQVAQLVETIDAMMKGKDPFVITLNKDVLWQVLKALAGLGGLTLSAGVVIAAFAGLRLR